VLFRSCNLNFYLVDMPVKSAGKDGDHYCDAQCFPDMGCCAEFDMNEGNDDVQQITNHACTHDYSGHPDWVCNKWGDPEDKTKASQFSEGKEHDIDSSKPYVFAQKFEVVKAHLVITTTMTQGPKEVVMTMGPSDQLNAMWKDGSLERGMAFVTGYWYAPDMNWLDGEECGSGAELCDDNPTYISNWRITTNGQPVPTPAPTPNPSPNPSPTPVPNPSGSKCYYGSCDGSYMASAWCDESESNCKSCGDGNSVWC